MILQFEPSPNKIFSKISRRNWWLCTDATRKQKDPTAQNLHDLITMLHHVLFFILHISNKFHEEPLTEAHGGSSTSLPITRCNRDDTQTFWPWICVFITFPWSIFDTKSNLNAVFCCGLMPAPLWRLQEHKKVTAHSLPLLQPPSPFSPILRPRLQVMLKNVPVCTKLPPCTLFPHLFFPFTWQTSPFQIFRNSPNT